MIEATPKSTFSSDFELSMDGRSLALLDLGSWREAAEFVIDGEAYTLSRERSMSGSFLLKKGDQVMAEAVKPSAFRETFELEHERECYVIRKPSIWRREFEVLRLGSRVGRIFPAGSFSRRALVDLPSEWPIPVQVFVFWLVLLIWNRAAAAAGS